MPRQNRRPGPSLSRRGRSPGAPASRSAVVPLRVMKLALVVRVDLGLGRGKVAAQSARAAVVCALANLGTPDFRAWLRDGSPGRGVLPWPGMDLYGNRVASAWSRRSR
jgi:hypothetical protein